MSQSLASWTSRPPLVHSHLTLSAQSPYHILEPTPSPIQPTYRSTLLEGSEYVDVPALSSKDYKLAVHCFTTAPTAATVTFKNEASGEYSFYELKYTVRAPPPRGTLSLECPVRTQTSTKVSQKAGYV